ncbi:hypothetical protein [Oceanidesulfovibrio marinus]|uniref:Uncharacterized protein n=1 Tax=Oceanidesulfovibrio marinus TaxID=370038 RepID=A0A6P1ZCZ1_9BACT|nr:hypothetical protein [Oceanidesulfovibrio marinus]TVM32130.1 hypothetical protein DQK91_16505 [Oceanidesulfovibrio marinus]
MSALPAVRELTAGQVRQLFKHGEIAPSMAEILSTPEDGEPIPWDVMAAMVEGGEEALEGLTLAEYEELSARALEVNADFFDRVRKVLTVVETTLSGRSTTPSTDSPEPDTADA